MAPVIRRGTGQRGTWCARVSFNSRVISFVDSGSRNFGMPLRELFFIPCEFGRQYWRMRRNQCQNLSKDMSLYLNPPVDPRD